MSVESQVTRKTEDIVAETRENTGEKAPAGLGLRLSLFCHYRVIETHLPINSDTFLKENSRLEEI